MNWPSRLVIGVERSNGGGSGIVSVQQPRLVGGGHGKTSHGGMTSWRRTLRHSVPLPASDSTPTSNRRRLCRVRHLPASVAFGVASSSITAHRLHVIGRSPTKPDQCVSVPT